jgi:hypothetical protein
MKIEKNSGYKFSGLSFNLELITFNKSLSNWLLNKSQPAVSIFVHTFNDVEEFFL